MPGIERIRGGTPMRVKIARFVILSAVLIPVLLVWAGSAEVGNTAGRAGGYRAVTFYVA